MKAEIIFRMILIFIYISVIIRDISANANSVDWNSFIGGIGVALCSYNAIREIIALIKLKPEENPKLNE